MHDAGLSAVHRAETILGAVRDKLEDDPAPAERWVRVLMEVVRPRATRSLEIEHAQALLYLALSALYDAIRSGASVDEHWEACTMAINFWKETLPRAAA